MSECRCRLRSALIWSAASPAAFRAHYASLQRGDTAHSKDFARFGAFARMSRSVWSAASPAAFRAHYASLQRGDTAHSKGFARFGAFARMSRSVWSAASPAALVFAAEFCQQAQQFEVQPNECNEKGHSAIPFHVLWRPA